MATTPNYSFSVYSSTDTDVRFLDFRVATAGSQSTSNFYVIDTVLKQHSDAIDSINATPSAFVVKGTYSSGSLYTASVANYPGYKNEQLIVLSLNQKNTGAVQININGTTNKDVMKYGSDGVLKAVDAGDFVANSPVLCLYDGTRFVVIGITSASSITVTGEAGDILQIADDGTIESSGKKTAQPNGIATLDENGNVVQVANMANSAAAVYSGEPVTVEYAGAQRIASITAYGETPQGVTTEPPVALTGVDSVHVCGRNLLPLRETGGVMNGITFTVNGDGSITLSGTATDRAVIYFVNTYRKIVLSKGIYTIGMSSVIPDGCSVSLGHYTGQHYAGSILRLTAGEASKSFQVSDITGYLEGFFEILSGTTVNTTIYPMLNLGESPLPYETYQGSVTPLPIPRPLHKVGDVRDVCRTRVKSVYDKRIVLDGSEMWAEYTDENWQGAGYHVYRFYNADALISQYIASNKYPSRRGASNFKGTLGVTSGAQSILFSVVEQKTVDDWKAYLAAQKAAGTPIIIYHQSTAYDGTNGLDVCLTEYQTGFVELDGETLAFTADGNNTYWNLPRGSSPGIARGPHIINSHFPSNVFESNVAYSFIFSTKTKMKPYFDTVEALNAYLTAQKSADTPVQIAYQLATPEVYATDPVDFDNAAGPLTVVTGGQVEVKMTDFVTDRTPAFLNKLDKTGDGSDVTVTFTEAATDTDIASGDKLSILFGKILKRFTNILNGTTKVGYATKADTDNLGNQITGTYANSLGVANNTIVLKNKIGENLSTITVPYANSAGNVATSIKEMGIAVQTASPYAWFLNYTGSGNKDGARKYYASVYADNATYSTSAGSSKNIVIYNNNWSGTDGSISAIYANAEKTYVNLASSNAAGTAWPNISVQRINGHALNMALNGTSLSITW